MSLINNMLKDLEQRENPRQPLPHITFIKKSHHTHLRGTRKWLLLIGTLSMLTVVSILWHMAHQSVSVAPPILHTTTQATTVNNNTQDMDWTKPAAITGVTLQMKDNTTEITFLLDHPALYRLTTSAEHNQLSITIDNASLRAELPPVSYLNTTVERIKAQPLNMDTKFTLFLAPGSLIKNINMNTTNTTAELVVAIEYQPTQQPTEPTSTAMAAPATVLPNQVVKTPAMQQMLTQQYQTALMNAEQGQYQSAIERLTSLLKMDPSFNDARVSLSALLIDQGNPLKARQFLDDGLNRQPEYVPFIELKARILATQGKFKQALTLLQTVSPALDENPEYHAFIAAMYDQTNQFNLAANIYKQLININTNNGSWWFGLAVSLDKLGQTKTALDAYTKAATAGHLNPESLAYLQNRLHRLQEVVDDKE